MQRITKEVLDHLLKGIEKFPDYWGKQLDLQTICADALLDLKECRDFLEVINEGAEKKKIKIIQ